jgi:hypothetical protein
VGGALLQQVLNNSEAAQQERGSMRLYVYSCKLILAAMINWRVEIDCRSYSAGCSANV